MTIDQSRVAFLQEMSVRHKNLVVWKHLDRALLGRGDVDAAAPVADVRHVRADAIDIAAATLDATHAICCDHIADKRIQFFVQPERLPQLFEFDVCVQPSRGLAPWADPHALVGLATLRRDGIRALRLGAEAVVSLVYHGISPGGGARLAGDELEIVQRGATDDLATALEACMILPPAPARRPLRTTVAVFRCVSALSLSVMHGRRDVVTLRYLVGGGYPGSVTATSRAL